jgi:CRP/FNR family transcriptional regulator, cyclic AMP receptor protein
MSCAECTDLKLSGDTIKSSPLGLELTKEECDRLAGIAVASGLEDGMFLLEEGHSDDTLHVITKGTLEVVKQTGGGDWVALKVIRPGDMVGELCFVDGIAHSAGVRAITNSEVFSLHRTDFEKLLTVDPQLMYKVMRAIIRTVHGIISNMNYQYVEMTNYITRQHGRY